MNADTERFFKAVRPDGMDFYSGTIDYAAASAVGGSVHPLSADLGQDGGFCRAGRLYAADVAAETLVGGEWPCRLFTVTGVPVDSDGHKHAFAELTVGAELESWRVFGPNGQEAVAVIAQAAALTGERVRRMAAARDAARTAASAAAWDAARTAARTAASAAAWDAARTAASAAAWDAARDAARTADSAAARTAASAAAWDAASAAAWDAARDAARTADSAAAWDAARAAVAVVVRDLITPEQFHTLYDPWAAASPEVAA